MKILVTGCAGFIGSHVVDGFIDGGREVGVVSIFISSMLKNKQPIIFGHKLVVL